MGEIDKIPPKCFSQSRSPHPMTSPQRGLRTGKTAATSDNRLNGAQRLNGALAVERFELTKMIPRMCWRGRTG